MLEKASVEKNLAITVMPLHLMAIDLEIKSRRLILLLKRVIIIDVLRNKKMLQKIWNFCDAS